VTEVEQVMFSLKFTSVLDQ